MQITAGRPLQCRSWEGALLMHADPRRNPGKEKHNFPFSSSGASSFLMMMSPSGQFCPLNLSGDTQVCGVRGLSAMGPGHS